MFLKLELLQLHLFFYSMLSSLNETCITPKSKKVNSPVVRIENKAVNGGGMLKCSQQIWQKREKWRWKYTGEANYPQNEVAGSQNYTKVMGRTQTKALWITTAIFNKYFYIILLVS